MPKGKPKQEQEIERPAIKLHPCWKCGGEMNIVKQGIAQYRMVCSVCKEETHAWFYAGQAEQERQERFMEQNKGEKQ